MSDLVAVVYMNRGWWVAMCPRPYCLNATFFGVSDRGEVGGLTPEYMMCGTCGGAWPAKWPSYDLRRGVEQLLGDRPDVTNRNWLPHESLSDLLWENLEHGILPASQEEIEAGGERTILSIRDDEITVGARAIDDPRRLSLPGGA